MLPKKRFSKYCTNTGFLGVKIGFFLKEKFNMYDPTYNKKCYNHQHQHNNTIQKDATSQKKNTAIQA